MKTWFTSLNGAITLSVIALLTELWRAFVDFQQVYSSNLDGAGAVLLVHYCTPSCSAVGHGRCCVRCADAAAH